MKLFKKILLLLLVVFVAMQFISPARNVSGQGLQVDVTKTIKVPDKVLDILKNACYDCHSNDSRYPWYVNVQPMGWIMANHIKDGKKDLNFSEFRSYSLRKQQSKLKSIATQVKDGEMPILSYTIMHADARLSKEQKELIIDWAISTKDSLVAKN